MTAKRGNGSVSPIPMVLLWMDECQFCLQWLSLLHLLPFWPSLLAKPSVSISIIPVRIGNTREIIFIYKTLTNIIWNRWLHWIWPIPRLRSLHLFCLLHDCRFVVEVQRCLQPCLRMRWRVTLLRAASIQHTNDSGREEPQVFLGPWWLHSRGAVDIHRYHQLVHVHIDHHWLLKIKKESLLL